MERVRSLNTIRLGEEILILLIDTYTGKFLDFSISQKLFTVLLYLLDLSFKLLISTVIFFCYSPILDKLVFLRKSLEIV